ncbi:b3d409c5-a32b-496c-8d99-8aee6d6eaf3d [Thermothielavioides terrestris]|uniref:B3d409c5-a32b-496c-8d99-8aee6d6eaf3d n=1 Tax=Thermothielavioides terrestris TaxID=2587410 RepID=A0A3S4C4R3_9PEZI|nr:b3d409c5-a32b-496c-8d99-8aee6d6eaf3d [Thermothielavioides terrestris]
MPPAPNPELRRQVIAIYKRKSIHLISSTLPVQECSTAELLFLGREYPQGYDYFRPRLHRAFMTKAHLTDENEIRQGIARAEFVKKEIEAL